MAASVTGKLWEMADMVKVLEDWEAAHESGLREPQAVRSVIRIIATTLLTLDACSFVFLLQVQTKFFLACERLPILLDPKLPFGDMADHGINPSADPWSSIPVE